MSSVTRGSRKRSRPARHGPACRASRVSRSTGRRDPGTTCPHRGPVTRRTPRRSHFGGGGSSRRKRPSSSTSSRSRVSWRTRSSTSGTVIRLWRRSIQSSRAARRSSRVVLGRWRCSPSRCGRLRWRCGCSAAWRWARPDTCEQTSQRRCSRATRRESRKRCARRKPPTVSLKPYEPFWFVANAEDAATRAALISEM